MKKRQYPVNALNLKKIAGNTAQSILLLSLVIDNSGSMNDKVNDYEETKFSILKKALRDMFDIIANDKLLKNSVEISIVKFDSSVEEIRTFSTVKKNQEISSSPSGVTKIGEAICYASDSLKKRQEHHLANASAHVLKPIMIVLSDGVPCESDPQALKKAIELCHSDEFITVPISIGEKNNYYLDELSPRVIKIDDFQIKEIFKGIVSATKSTINTASSNAFNDLLQSCISWSQITGKSI